MGNTFSCLPLSAANGKHKTSYECKVISFQKNAKERKGCVSIFPFVGTSKKNDQQVSSCSKGDKLREEKCLNITTSDQSATNVQRRAMNSKRFPKPLKIEENSRYAGQVPILLSEFTVSIPALSSSKRAEDIATNCLYKNTKRQRLSLFDNSDTPLAVPVSNHAYEVETVEGYQLPRHRSFSLDNGEVVVYRCQHRYNADKGRWRKYLKYSGAVKKCLDAFEYRRNTLDCPSSLDRTELESSKRSKNHRFTLVTFNNAPYLGTPDSRNDYILSVSVEQPTKLSRYSTSAAEPSFATSITYEDDQESDLLLYEAEYISDNVEYAIGSKRPQSMSEVVRICRHVNENSSTND
ncbi:hypothetical protein GpartN1_g68.t1 [Galdieria partita]|uniref:Uncharacterized protein n=1 Tax=Galdieria partita TaxID=83374 RepID=A0A9C7PR86_9RHOD|nr:hypothetical protein GpartN1_g68.t1 [Galdieria partita]